MSIKVVYNSYSELCGSYSYGQKLLELPDEVIERIDELFDGQEIEAYGDSNPDNLYVNGLYEVDTQEALIDYAKILNHGEYEQLVNEDRLSAYVEEHEEEIVSRINDSYIYLGHDDDSWFLLQ